MPKLTANEVAARLKELRTAAKVSMRELVKSSGLSLATISNVEKSVHYPRLTTVRLYLTGLNDLTGSSLKPEEVFPELY